MTRQQLATLKHKAFNAGKRAALRNENPKLPDCENVSLAELEVLLNAMQDGLLELGWRKLGKR